MSTNVCDCVFESRSVGTMIELKRQVKSYFSNEKEKSYNSGQFAVRIDPELSIGRFVGIRPTFGRMRWTVERKADTGLFPDVPIYNDKHIRISYTTLAHSLQLCNNQKFSFIQNMH